ncbi:protein-glutamate methylesterase/protein-glutamine glutaminase [Thermotalea metallivorans]|uniref:Protein-glutamate methylesterase/protein-glutamine glutaminase n=1 Tax=Thermotalea metallivorans TaxID=520762 RepID=A0A140L5E4_9FIRM|nr:chemotaxis response regulator protein-glutamate methylesterase [Thermotalea metallivorans]KXG75769.1 Chemotaxis response regulator protein-glutamate methylesterase [Thermotalea metallivorans]
MKKLNVLVVDDSAFMRKVIADIIQLDDDLKVIGTAKNGQEAIEKIKELSPDVVTMDVEMPVMDGITALKTIMEEMPLPVLMLSSLTKEGADATVKALELGAVDFITKPSSIFKMNTEEIKAQLHEKLKMASKANMKSKHVLKPQNIATINKNAFAQEKNTNVKYIVAIGTSTGGPRALQSVIPYLPKNIPASILIVQHMPPGFTKSLAERLNNLSEIEVKEAEDGSILLPGHAYIAPGDYHMKIIRSSNVFKIKLTKDSPVSGHRPSVDYMMNSLAQLELSNVIGVIMTGMGSDGAEGMKNIKLQKGITIGQNEETCVVYGMPKSAVSLGCVDILVPLEDIAESIIKAVGV